MGGGGRAKGFGGPPAPADKTALALGEGGGRTMWSFRAGLAEAFALRSVVGELPTADSSLSEASDGICRLSFGRAPEREPEVSLRCGGGNSVAVVCGREGCGRCGLTLGWAVTLLGGGRRSGEDFFALRGVSEEPKKCCASTEPPSSMGVNILRDFEDRCRG